MSVSTKKVRLAKSFEYLKRAKKVLPAQTHTFSKGYHSFVEGAYPIFLKNGKGCYLVDVDGNKYTDYIIGLGPIILGYSDKSVNAAVSRQLKDGVSFSMPHKIEVEMAELMTEVIQFADAAKFTKTGSDAVTAAIRASRAITGKDRIAYCGGGGVWHDWFTVITSRNKGIPKSEKEFIKIFEYNNIESLKKILDDDKEIGTVCMEPMIFQYPKNNYLNQVKKIVHQHDAILIFDEVVTGFRFSLGGASEFFGVKPDIAAYGKAIANGFPLGAIAGKMEYMQIFEEIFYSTTFAGEAVSLAAGFATINKIRDDKVPSYISNMGNRFSEEFNRVAKEIGVPIETYGFPSKLYLSCKDGKGEESLSVKSLFCQELVNNGVLMGQPPIFHSFSHKESDTKNTLYACRKAFLVVKKAIENNTVEKSLKGKPMNRVMTFPV